MTSRFALIGLVFAGLACSSPTSSGGGNPPPPPPPSGGPSVVNIADNGFAPAGVTVTAGSIVRWSNGGTNAHTSTSDTGVWDSGSMFGATVDNQGYSTGGGTYERTFTTAGSYAYHCTHHPTMQGTIFVTQ